MPWVSCLCSCEAHGSRLIPGKDLATTAPLSPLHVQGLSEITPAGDDEGSSAGARDVESGLLSRHSAPAGSARTGAPLGGARL